MSNDITRYKNSDKYTRLFEAAQDGILLLEHPSGLITDANPYICSMLGYSREELIGRKMWEIGFVADKALARVAHDELIKEGYVRYDEISLQKMNGEIFECEFVCNAYSVGEATPHLVIQCNIRDISKRRKAERELAEAAVAKTKLLHQAIASLSNVIESRDPYTAGHQKRVAHLASAIANKMGLPDSFVECLYLACLVHDIGKMSIPVEILTKPVALNELEKEMLRSHPRIGYEIVKHIEFSCPVAEAVLQHHERLDGSGYPGGLKGDEITISGQITAVADTVESMSSNRPYRPSRGIEAALAEVEKGRGTLFNEDAVDACLALFRQDGYELQAIPDLEYSGLSPKSAALSRAKIQA